VRAYLGVFSGNEAAIRLYSRLGFATVGESPDLLFE
jgi:RimJ/RimL family protein N-acetyltransferase